MGDYDSHVGNLSAQLQKESLNKKFSVQGPRTGLNPPKTDFFFSDFGLATVQVAYITVTVFHELKKKSRYSPNPS